MGWWGLVTSSDESPAPLSIGAVYGGTPAIDEAWMPDIGALMRDVIARREGVTSPLNVNVVFHVDGELLPPVDFQGVRTGRLSRKRMHLMMQAAVPPDPGQERRAVLVKLLRDAVAEAEALARRRKIADGLPEIRAIVESITQG